MLTQLFRAIMRDNYRAALYATAQNARRAARLAARLGEHADRTELVMFADRIGGEHG